MASQDYYSQSAAEDRTVRIDMMLEREAVEFFACNPKARVWLSGAE